MVVLMVVLMIVIVMMPVPMSVRTGRPRRMRVAVAVRAGLWLEAFGREHDVEAELSHHVVEHVVVQVG